jgi:tRNA(His) 5'-end guanylyltransferase
VAAATAALKSQSVSSKNELLFQRGINFNEVPLWQRRGTGLYWEAYQHEGFNPKLQQPVMATRRRVKVDGELAMGDDYGRLIRRVMSEAPGDRSSE